MANTVNSINPTSTVAAFAPDFRGEAKNTFQTANLGVNNATVLPKIESFPASFLIVQEGNAQAECRSGIITAISASKIIVSGGTLVSATAAANTIVPTISSGVITLTSHASTHTGTNPVFVTRLT